jgi:hypothetical protein
LHATGVGGFSSIVNYVSDATTYAGAIVTGLEYSNISIAPYAARYNPAVSIVSGIASGYALYNNPNPTLLDDINTSASVIGGLAGGAAVLVSFGILSPVIVPTAAAIGIGATVVSAGITTYQLIQDVYNK